MDPSRQLREAVKKAERLDSRNTEELLGRVTEILRKEPRLIRLPPGPLILVGDTHGDWMATRSLLSHHWDSQDIFVFLGDYVDRGPNQAENINLLYHLKCMAPERLILLRGNHEAPDTNLRYGFYSEVEWKMERDLYPAYARSFAHLPLAAVSLSHGLFAVHGGLAEGLNMAEEIDELPREVEPQHPVTFQLLWNDPREGIRGFAPNIRGGGSRIFGGDVVERFLDANKLKLIVRAHEVLPFGFSEFFDGKLISLFSCRSYGMPIAGKALRVDEKGRRQLIPV